LAKWVPNSAGDPEGQADSRSSAFTEAKILKISTPLVVPGCRITSAFEDGTREYYDVPCPHCGHEQTLEIENFLAGIDEEHPHKSAFSCIECGALIEEHHRDAIVRAGHWVARSPEKASHHRSFSFWAAYSPLKSFELIARAWLSARGDQDSEKTFYNDVAGRPYHVKGEAPPWEMLRNREEDDGYARGTIPHGGLAVTVGWTSTETGLIGRLWPGPGTIALVAAIGYFILRCPEAQNVNLGVFVKQGL
jgi:phage terminase large subunit GpA-like protein